VPGAAHPPASSAVDAVAPLLDRVRASGGRITPARRAVLEVLVEAGSDHLSADEIAERVHASAPQVHLSTVYRNLDSLEEAGVLRRARLGDGPASYHLAADEHHHAVCDRCGVVIRVPAEAFAPVVDALAREHGFRAEPRHVTIDGLCATCASESHR
jgi:Fe2+ or Zn2+ uptake regulation protein